MTVWKQIPFTKGSYSASNKGEIRRDKPVKGNHKAGQKIAQNLDRYGYPQVSLGVEGKQKTMSVHRLVALAFHGEPPEGKPQINHRNGVKTDNRPENIHWCSVTYNLRHALALGLRVNPKGSRVGGAKLTEAQVKELRSRKPRRGLQRQWAREFGVSEATISLILNHKEWGHA